MQYEYHQLPAFHTEPAAPDPAFVRFFRAVVEWFADLIGWPLRRLYPLYLDLEIAAYKLRSLIDSFFHDD